MSEPDTPATSQDPSLPGEGDYNQLTKEETLEDRGVDDLLDEGYSPPDRDPLRGKRWTQEEQLEGESVSDRVEQEEPEVWEGGEQPPAYKEPDRAGRLEELPDDDDPSDTVGETQDVYANDVGVDGGAASAEEAAVRVRSAEEAGAMFEPGSPTGEDEGSTR